MEFLDKVLEFINTASGPTVVVVLVGVVDFIFRMIPTQKPKSVVYLVAGIIKKVGEVLVKLGNLLDKVLPQVTK